MKKLDTDMLTDIITNADKWSAGTIVQFSYANKEMTLSKASSESFNYIYEITFVTGPMIQSYKFRTIEDAMFKLVNGFKEFNEFASIEEAMKRNIWFQERFSAILCSYYDRKYKETICCRYTVKGELTDAQKKTILECTEEGEFIPGQVWSDGEYTWHRIDRFETAVYPPKDDALTPNELVAAFKDMSNGWRKAIPSYDISDSRPYVVLIEEKRAKEFVVWAADKAQAEKQALDLRDRKYISLQGVEPYEDEAEAKRIASADDVRALQHANIIPNASKTKGEKV